MDEEGVVLFEEALAGLRIFRLGNGIFEEGFLELVKGYEDGEDFRKGFLEISFRGCLS